MTETNTRPGRRGRMSGRQAEAARNDQRILASARAVFVADPGAPITAVAKHAGVGISALYTRYGSKEELLRTLCTDGLLIVVQETEAALERVRQGAGLRRFHAPPGRRGHQLDDPRPGRQVRPHAGDVRPGQPVKRAD